MSKKFQKICALTIIFAFMMTILPMNILANEAYAASVTVTATNAKNITETNATVQGKVKYSGTRPSAVGLYIGTSSSNMSHAASEKINHKKNPFDMWYDLNKEVNMKLQPGTTYYYQCYAVQNGKEYKSNVVSFKTAGTAATQQTVVKDSITVTTTSAKNITQTNATVQGQVNYTGTRPGTAGIYFGESSGNMRMIASDAINHNKNPFDMWYDLNSEAGIYLQPGTTYYYQCYAIQNGKEVRGGVASFTTPQAPANNNNSNSNTNNNNSVNNSISVTTSSAKNITANNATVYGKISYQGTRPSTVGIYLGTSSGNMKKVASDRINHNKNPFDMWYDLKSEAGITLQSDTTYYYQCYAVQNGNTVTGDVKTFRTSSKPVTLPAEEQGTTDQKQGMLGSAATTAPEHDYDTLGRCKDCGKEYPIEVFRMVGTSTATAYNAAIHSAPYGDAPIVDRTDKKAKLTLWEKLQPDKYGTSVKIYSIDAYTYNCFGNRWYRIVKSNGTKVGWINEDYLEFSYSKEDTEAQHSTIVVEVDGKEVFFSDQTPIIKNSRVLIPVRAITNAMGKQVAYNDGAITISGDKKIMFLRIDSKKVTYYEDGMTDEGKLDVAPTVINGRTMLPIRAIAEFFDYQAVWNGDIRMLTITKK